MSVNRKVTIPSGRACPGVLTARTYPPPGEVAPLSLTLLTDAVPASKRGLALGAWSGIAGLAIALGPLVGGAVTEGIAWQWIFWLDVPLGLLMLPLTRTKLTESHSPNRKLDLPGLALAAAGLLGIAVLAAVFAHQGGYDTPSTFVAGFTPALTIGAATLAAGAAAALLIPRRRSSAVRPVSQRSGSRARRTVPAPAGL